MGFAARVNDMHTCPMQIPGPPVVPHVGGPILPPGNTKVKIGGEAAACVGDTCTCTGGGLIDSITKGSTSVKIGGRFAARKDDPTAHGGTIQGFCPTVKIGG
jgi:uncharacterized Zn-binding protein involved in type VI secretion